MPSRAVSVYVTLAILACTEPARPEPERTRPAQTEEPDALEPAYRVVAVEEPGAIAGAISWTGGRPEAAVLPVRVHARECGEQRSQALRISESGGVRDTVLWLSDVREGAALEPPREPPAIVSSSCRFEPHVLAVGIGAPIVFRSEDAVMHNVHGRAGDRTVWDFAQPERGASAQRIVEAPGIVHNVCDVHAWSESWIHAFAHPYFAVSDEQGRYRITGVPAGQYVLRVWHEGWRVVGSASGRPRYSSPVVLTRTVSVSARQETTLDFELSQELAEMAGD